MSATPGQLHAAIRELRQKFDTLELEAEITQNAIIYLVGKLKKSEKKE